MTESTPRLALPLLQAGQAQKEIFHNEALVRIDAALHPAVVAVAIDTPPAAPAIGQAWIVGTSPGGDWAGQAGRLAIWTGGGWRFVAPVAGMTAWMADAGRWAWHDGITWRSGALPTGGIAVNGKPVVGARQPAIPSPAGGVAVDAEARLAISNILATLRDHGLIEA